jgi:hypothetical protein
MLTLYSRQDRDLPSRVTQYLMYPAKHHDVISTYLALALPAHLSTFY